MKRDEPENLDLLAAEYVLGTLWGPARRSFERRRARDPFVDRRVRAWEDRFALLSLRLRPVSPSPAVWPAIERRIGGSSRSGWRALAAAVALIAVLGFGWIVWQELRPPQATAVLATERERHSGRSSSQPRVITSRLRQWAKSAFQTRARASFGHCRMAQRRSRSD